MSKSRANFVRLAESRTNKVLKDLDLLSNLSNRSNYAYSEEDVQKIYTVISKKLKMVQSKFDAGMKLDKDKPFTL